MQEEKMKVMGIIIQNYGIKVKHLYIFVVIVIKKITPSLLSSNCTLDILC